MNAFSSERPIRIATRGSRLALVQAAMVRAALINAWPELAGEGHIVVTAMTTSGDRFQGDVLADAGGKGLFTKEIEEALLSGEADLAVHSVKDMPALSQPGLMLTGTLEREDARDALICAHASCIGELPKGTVFGTSSPRRTAQLLSLRPDLLMVPLRGNVPKRLEKMKTGVAQATLLAMAGLNRLQLNLAEIHAHPVAPEEILPAGGQGAIGIECRADNTAIRTLIEAINHIPTFAAIAAERALLAGLGGSCRTPIGAYAVLENEALLLRGQLASTDGRVVYSTERLGAVADAAYLGKDAAQELLSRAGPTFITE